jgi:hypothetical protein
MAYVQMTTTGGYYLSCFVEQYIDQDQAKLLREARSKKLIFAYQRLMYSTRCSLFV